MIDLNVPRYPVSLAAKVCGLNHGAARAWTPFLVMSANDKKAAVAGDTAFLTGLTVLQMAIAVRLVRQGMGRVAACRAATAFTIERGGELMEKGRTVLVAYADGQGNVLSDKSELGEVIFPRDHLSVSHGRQEWAVILVLDFIVKHIVTALAEVAAA